MIQSYETVLIIDAALTDEQIESTIKSVEDFLAGKAEVKNVDRRGKRRLAYDIKKKSHGFYTVIDFDAELRRS